MADPKQHEERRPEPQREGRKARPADQEQADEKKIADSGGPGEGDSSATKQPG